MNKKLRKVARFIAIYGFRKSLFKVFGRLRLPFFRLKPKKNANIGVIGAGQYAYATIGFALYKFFGNRFVNCFDINEGNAISFCSFYGLGQPCQSAQELVDHPDIGFIYIASNHASHTDYALKILAAGKVPFIEKPVSVNYQQFICLVKGIRRCGLPVFVGYNRPFSSAVRLLKSYSHSTHEPITLNCFVSGHQLPSDHWYRRPEEGTRICGNVGHWLDLAVHILSWGELVDRWRIFVIYSNENARDDDISIALTSERGDLVTILITSRSEPFEGINESINFQQGDLIAKIDDFRTMTIWEREKLARHRFWPKDVGHNLALTQPFTGVSRNWQEIELSTMLMLFIAEMVVSGEQIKVFSFSETLQLLGLDETKVPGVG